MARKKQSDAKRYQQHTISISPEHWDYIEKEAQERKIPKSNFIANLIEQHKGSAHVKIENYLAMKYFNEWFKKAEDMKNWGIHMWTCDNFLDPFYFADTSFHRKWVEMRPYVTKENLEVHLSHSNEYNEIFQRYVNSKEDLTSFELYYKGAIAELANPEGVFKNIAPADKIEVIKKVQHYIRKYPRKFNIRLMDTPARMQFQIYGTPDGYWAYIWGSYVYIDTGDPKITEGLFYEFDQLWKGCATSEADLEKFLNSIIQRIEQL